MDGTSPSVTQTVENAPRLPMSNTKPQRKRVLSPRSCCQPQMDRPQPKVLLDKYRLHLEAELRRLQQSLANAPPSPPDSRPQTPLSSCKSMSLPEKCPFVAPKIKVAILGASDRSDSSIIEGVLESPETFVRKPSPGIPPFPRNRKD